VDRLIEALDRSDPTLRAQLYEELGINGVYHPNSHTVHVQAELVDVLVVSEGRLAHHAYQGSPRHWRCRAAFRRAAD
jgi:hypothetical protein